MDRTGEESGGEGALQVGQRGEEGLAEAAEDDEERARALASPSSAHCPPVYGQLASAWLGKLENTSWPRCCATFAHFNARERR